MTHETESPDDPVYGMNLEFQAPPEARLGDGFNEHGVRTNDDGSLDVRFEAMEPGVWRGVEITEEFLDGVARDADGNIPVQMDHSKSQRLNVGRIDPRKIQFGEKLLVEAHIPNTGSSVRDDVIADFSHDPPEIRDISIAFHPDSVEVEAPDKRGEPPRFVDADIREFSLTPFPAGYDEGGLTPAFSEAVGNAIADTDPEDDDETEFSEAESQLITRPHLLTTTTIHD